MQWRVSAADDVYRDDPDKEPRRDTRRLAVLWRLTALLRPHRARFVLAVGDAARRDRPSRSCYPQAATLRGRRRHDRGRTTAASSTGSCSGSSRWSSSTRVFVWLRHYSMSWLGERVVADLRALVVRSHPHAAARVVPRAAQRRARRAARVRRHRRSRASSAASCRWRLRNARADARRARDAVRDRRQAHAADARDRAADRRSPRCASAARSA